MTAVDASSREDYLKAGGTLSTLFGGVGSYLGPDHRIWAFTLVGIGAAILASTVVLQISRKGAVRAGSGAISVLALLIFGFFGYHDILHPPKASNTTTTSAGPAVKGSADTEGDNAPAVVGTGNVVNYGTAPPAAKERSQPGHKRRQSRR